MAKTKAKGLRRTKQEIAKIKGAMYELLSVEHPMTVRQAFYRLVSLGVIPKTEAAYKATVIRLLTSMRLNDELPFGWLSDNTRWMRKPRCFSSSESALRITAECYRRDIWQDQDAYVEVWLEKDALAGVLYAETEKWHVPLMVTRGYPSLTYLFEAAEVLTWAAEQGKTCHLYYFGDHDPSGVDIPRSVEANLRRFAPDADITFERVAVTPEQIVEFDLPTRPTKKTDSRSKNFDGESVEVDAIPPATLRGIVREKIEVHVEPATLELTKQIEKTEREQLEGLYQALKNRRVS